MRHLLLLLFTLISFYPTLAQGIRGTIRTKANEPLPYAAIAVKGTPTGTLTNTEGKYELALKPGRYILVFQYLGFQTLERAVEIGSDWQTIDVAMEEQAIRLEEVQARQGKEDPAYSIMRRAIAKAKFHELQVISYTARAYTKSSITVTDLPMQFLYRNQLKEAEKEGFKVGEPLLFETVAEVSFKYPNTYRQRILGSRNSLGDNSPATAYFLASFYRPEVNNAVSPLSPKAFGYYKFEYQGTFREKDIEISKIRVIPRAYGEGVFRGVIYIIENTWAIHSLQLETRNPIGFDITIRQVYSPLQGVWLPINQRYNLTGRIMGAAGNAQLVINQTFKELKTNPAFVDDVQVIDEKIDQPAVRLSNRDIKGQKLEDKIAKQKEYSTKDFRKLMKEYEKQEYKARKERSEDVSVSRNDSMVVDSMARKRGTAFWDSLRAVPLTSAEVASYKKRDSLKVVRDIKVQTDSTKQSRNAKKDTTGRRRSSRGFRVGQVFSGNTWSFSKRTALTWDSPLEKIYYNTVEGYTVDGGLRLRYFLRTPQRDTTRRRNVNTPTPDLTFGGTGRYEFGRKRFIGFGTVAYHYKNTVVDVSGGRFVNQFNPNEPISPFLNTITTLLFERNFAKLYQRDFLRLNVTARPFQNRFSFVGGLEYAERTELANYKENIKPWFDWKRRSYTPNRPDNVELGPAAFPVHQALVLNLTLTGKLGEPQYRIRNGRRIAGRNLSPELMVNYRKGIAGVAGSDVDYDFLQAGLSHSFETGIRSRLSYNVRAGSFLNRKAVYFPDFQHFQGNEFFLQQGDPTAIFRMLPYYQFSTGKQFVEGHVLMEYRKFLITQLTLVRLTGLKENLFIHYLGTPNSRNYTELGYGLDGLIPGIFPFFRVEVVSQWQDWKYQKLGFRIGTTLKFR